MTARDAAAFDRETDTLAVNATTADELFAVVDLLDLKPSMRRALTDPSATVDQRQQLASRIFGSHVGVPALDVLNVVLKEGQTRQLPSDVERQAVRGVLRHERDAGNLDQVQTELYQFVDTVSKDQALSDALRNKTLPLENRQGVVSKLTAGKVLPASEQLLRRAAAGRVRNILLTVEWYLELAAGIMQQSVAKVTVAKPLDEARVQRLKTALEAQAGGPVSLQIDVDPQVIGGIDVEFGNNIIESTVAGRLAEARRLLKSPSKVGRNG